MSVIERSLYIAALCYTRKMPIVRERLVDKLRIILYKLIDTPALRVFRRGLTKSLEFIANIASLPEWMSPLKKWLKDPDYIFWLGTASARLDRTSA